MIWDFFLGLSIQILFPAFMLVFLLSQLNVRQRLRSEHLMKKKKNST